MLFLPWFTDPFYFLFLTVFQQGVPLSSYVSIRKHHELPFQQAESNMLCFVGFFFFYIATHNFSKEKCLGFCLFVVLRFFNISHLPDFTGNFLFSLNARTLPWLYLLILNKYLCSSLLSSRLNVMLVHCFWFFLNLQCIALLVTSTQAHNRIWILLSTGYILFLHKSNHVTIFFVKSLNLFLKCVLRHFSWWFASTGCRFPSCQWCKPEKFRALATW